MSFVATLGYISFLIGPPVLGFLGEEQGLRGALIVPLGLKPPIQSSTVRRAP
ncbi:hypothetical protein V6S67_18440 [Arthrobacter sp. Soc17.1.1.1]|uniref:hypothetical protein n=1 Tax=Arthrobacter sp. Soc17.1.1.1 TaxID=3121277 RepID=UPI002FE4CBEA